MGDHIHVWTRTQQEREEGKPFWCHECFIPEPEANYLPWAAVAPQETKD